MTRDEKIEKVAHAICQSKTYETGQGTCALLCMNQLGDARKPKCNVAVKVHRRLAGCVVDALVEG